VRALSTRFLVGASAVHALEGPEPFRQGLEHIGPVTDLGDEDQSGPRVARDGRGDEVGDQRSPIFGRERTEAPCAGPALSDRGDQVIAAGVVRDDLRLRAGLLRPEGLRLDAHTRRDHAIEDTTSWCRVAASHPIEYLDHGGRCDGRFDHHPVDRLELLVLRDRYVEPGDDASHASVTERDPHQRSNGHLRGEILGDEVVEGLVHAPRRHERNYRSNALRQVQRRRSSSALSVSSHVKSLSERPKWPYAAVLR
jgi:hypothetical protein